MIESSQSLHLILMPVDCNEWRLQAARCRKMKFISQSTGSHAIQAKHTVRLTQAAA